MKPKDIIALALAGAAGATATSLALPAPTWPYLLAGGILGIGGTIGVEGTFEALVFGLSAGIPTLILCVGGKRGIVQCLMLTFFFGCCTGRLVYGIYKDFKGSPEH